MSISKLFSVVACCIAIAGCNAHGAAKDAIRSQLKDPGSAQFRDLLSHDATTCGYVNSKNSYGAYAGFSPFVVGGTYSRILDSEADPLWVSTCAWRYKNQY